MLTYRRALHLLKQSQVYRFCKQMLMSPPLGWNNYFNENDENMRLFFSKLDMRVRKQNKTKQLKKDNRLIKDHLSPLFPQISPLLLWTGCRWLLGMGCLHVVYGYYLNS